MAKLQKVQYSRKDINKAFHRSILSLLRLRLLNLSTLRSRRLSDENDSDLVR